MLKALPSGYIVHFMYNGKMDSSLHKNYHRAQQVAAERHGVAKPLYEPEDSVVLPHELVNNVVNAIEIIEDANGPISAE